MPALIFHGGEGRRLWLKNSGVVMVNRRAAKMCRGGRKLGDWRTIRSFTDLPPDRFLRGVQKLRSVVVPPGRMVPVVMIPTRSFTCSMRHHRQSGSEYEIGDPELRHLLTCSGDKNSWDTKPNGRVVFTLSSVPVRR